MVDFNEYGINELVAMRDELNATIKAKRAEAKEVEKSTREARGAKMRETLAGVEEGTGIVFMYNKEETAGTFVRASEKSVTVKFVKDGEEIERYRKYHDIVSVDTVADAPEETEAVDVAV